jgi:AcrR family transcriptional regulator
MPTDTQTSPSVEETRQRIILAAAELITEKGYARTTTRAIAAAAGVNEVTLFRHFGSKRNLFAALINQHSALPNLSELLKNQLTGDYRQDLSRLGRTMLTAIIERQDAMRLVLCEAHELPELREIMIQIPHQLRQLTSDYLKDQIQSGLIKDWDPEIMAQAFLGMFFAYGIGREILGGPAVPEISLDELVDHFVDIFVAGTVQPDKSP